MQSQTPVRLIAITRFHSSSLYSWVRRPAPPIPALLNAQSSRPKAVTARSTIASTAADFATSVLTKIASLPASLTILRVSWPPGSTTSASINFAPSRAKIFAVARPIPEPAPVITAILPSNIPATYVPPFLQSAVQCWGPIDLSVLSDGDQPTTPLAGQNHDNKGSSRVLRASVAE